jgi:hypothetical protein
VPKDYAAALMSLTRQNETFERERELLEKAIGKLLGRQHPPSADLKLAAKDHDDFARVCDMLADAHRDVAHALRDAADATH